MFKRSIDRTIRTSMHACCYLCDFLPFRLRCQCHELLGDPVSILNHAIILGHCDKNNQFLHHLDQNNLDHSFLLSCKSDNVQILREPFRTWQAATRRPGDQAKQSDRGRSSDLRPFLSRHRNPVFLHSTLSLYISCAATPSSRVFLSFVNH